tara:strand:- start:1964 stop:2467 length:504 start_codon:yes stop_codon:yes gene_type:complete
MINWYAINTKSNLENYVIEQLNKDGYITYIPKFIATVSHARKVKKVMKPLFPGYFFVLIEENSHDFRKINFTHGVISILSAGLEPIKIKQSIIDNLKKLENEKGNIRINKAFNYFEGMKIKLTDGIFRGKIGSFAGIKNTETILVLLDVLGRSIKVPVLESTTTPVN